MRLVCPNHGSKVQFLPEKKRTTLWGLFYTPFNRLIKSIKRTSCKSCGWSTRFHPTSNKRHFNAPGGLPRSLPSLSKIICLFRVLAAWLASAALFTVVISCLILSLSLTFRLVLVGWIVGRARSDNPSSYARLVSFVFAANILCERSRRTEGNSSCVDACTIHRHLNASGNASPKLTLLQFLWNGHSLWEDRELQL